MQLLCGSLRQQEAGWKHEKRPRVPKLASIQVKENMTHETKGGHELERDDKKFPDIDYMETSTY